MARWQSFLNGLPIDWLLEPDNSSVRYLALVDILDRQRNHNEVREAKKMIMETGAVPRILEKQEMGGYWERPEDFYIRTKYKGTVWQTIILAELLADGSNDRIRDSCEFLLRRSQDPESGAFCYRSGEHGFGDSSTAITCLTSNMVFSLVRFGYLKDPRVRKAMKWIANYQRFDDGAGEAPGGWPYLNDRCWGTHSCMMGVVKALKALAEIPASRRTKAAKNTIREGAEFILKHHICRESHNLKEVANESWIQFGFPLLWQTDALEMLLVLTKLGYSDNRMQEAVDLVVSKQDGDGRWLLERTFNGRFQVNIERKGKPSKWITLNALRVLKRFYGA